MNRRGEDPPDQSNPPVDPVPGAAPTDPPPTAPESAAQPQAPGATGEREVNEPGAEETVPGEESAAGPPGMMAPSPRMSRQRWLREDVGPAAMWLLLFSLSLAPQLNVATPVWFRLILGVVSLSLSYKIFPGLWRDLWSFAPRPLRDAAIVVRRGMRLLSPYVAAVTVAVVVTQFGPTWYQSQGCAHRWLPRLPGQLPCEIEEARAAINRIVLVLRTQQVANWLSGTNYASWPTDVMTMLNYDLLVQEPFQPSSGSTGTLRVFIIKGERVAEDIRTKPEPWFLRKHFRRGDEFSCNFAIEYIEDSGTVTTVEYYPECGGKPEVFTLASPVFWPVFPILGYR